jgi:hypothetical protein
VQRKRNKILVTCQSCSKEFWTWPSRIRAGFSRFCSQECKANSQRGSRKLPSNTTCQYCGNEFRAKQADLSKGKSKYCSTSCSYAARRQSPFEVLVQNRAIDPDTGCWNWLGAPLNTGYCQVIVGGVRWSVHRISAHLFLGLDPDSGLMALHHCDNRRCFNPDHLYIGTQADNMRDVVVRDRRQKREG